MNCSHKDPFINAGVILRGKRVKGSIEILLLYQVRRADDLL